MSKEERCSQVNQNEAEAFFFYELHLGDRSSLRISKNFLWMNKYCRYNDKKSGI